MADLSSDLLSHTISPVDFSAVLSEAKQAVRERPEMSPQAGNEYCEVLDQLAELPMGRAFIANHGGFDGYWTWYLINRPNMVGPCINELEAFLAFKSPVVLATRERFEIFNQEIQKRLKEGICIVSLPCGVMQDLMTLNLSGYYDVSLIGVDLDPNALRISREWAKAAGLESICHFQQSDAWHLELAEPVDIITSNGLNIYEPDDDRVTALYRQFWKGLKPGGTLITSFTTPAPQVSHESPWRMDKINQDDLARSKMVLVDIMQPRWSTCARTHATTLRQLQAAGFVDIQFIDGEAGIFPTVIATKPED